MHVNRSGRPTAPRLMTVLLCLLVLTSAPHADRLADRRVADQAGSTDLDGLSDALEALAAQVSPAVVQIFTTAQSPGQGLVPSTGALVTTERGSGSGVIVADVVPQGPADLAGLRVGDIVLQMNGKPMENARQLLVNLYPRAVAETVTLDVLRDDLPLRFEVTVVEQPGDPRQLEALADPARHLVSRLGILAFSLDPAVARWLPPVRFAASVVVAATAADGAAARVGGFAPGDAIYAINGQRIHDLEELRTQLSSFARGATLVVQLERRSRLRYLTFVID